jgi:archaemetzincin
MDWAGSIAATVLMLVIAVAQGCDENQSENNSARVRSIRRAMDDVRPLFDKKRPPEPGDWLAEHREKGQTFEQYLRSNPNRPTKSRTTIYVQPLGKFSKEQRAIIDTTVDYLARFYQTPVRTLPPIGLDDVPEDARRTHPTWGDRQLLTTYVLDTLLPPRLPRDGVAMLALTTSDLWPGEGWNFVFGQASLRKRVGVWSIYRNGDPSAGEAERKQCFLRTIKTASHELGHMLGIQHCTAYECAMNGSNHQAESDSRPLAFCPECSGKIWWACGADPKKQLQSLAEYAGRHELTTEAEFWKGVREMLIK